ncbi:MAG: phosphatase domain-containing protein [Pseudomonadota bacterium]
MIERVFHADPTLLFALVGDSGQRDTEIYAYIADKQPNRIHNVTSG